MEYLYFAQHGSGPIRIALTRAIIGEELRLERALWEPVKMIAYRTGGWVDLREAQLILAPHHINRNWYRPSPEVLAYAKDGPPRGTDWTQVTPRIHGGGPKLTPEQALEVFRLAHSTSQGYAVVGARFGISARAVAKIARGQAYAWLFKREDAGVAPPSTAHAGGIRRYYVSEAGDPAAPKYLMNDGVRSVK